MNKAKKVDFDEAPPILDQEDGATFSCDRSWHKSRGGRPGCAHGRSQAANENVAYKILFTEDALDDLDAKKRRLSAKTC